MLGVTGDQETVFDDPALGNPDVSSAVQAVVSWFGPTDFATMDEQAAEVTACGGPVAGPRCRRLTGVEVARRCARRRPEVTAQTNLGSYVAGAPVVPAFYFAHGDSDCNVPDGQSRQLARFSMARVPRQTVAIVEGAGHADPRSTRSRRHRRSPSCRDALGG